jgi:hypothetical protein
MRPKPIGLGIAAKTVRAVIETSCAPADKIVAERAEVPLRTERLAARFASACETAAPPDR